MGLREYPPPSRYRDTNVNNYSYTLVRLRITKVNLRLTKVGACYSRLYTIIISPKEGSEATQSSTMGVSLPILPFVRQLTSL